MSDDSASLWKRVEPISSPLSLWSGVRLRRGLVPDNILLFSRTYTAPPPPTALGSYHPRYVVDTVLGGRGVLQIGSDWFLIVEGEAALIFPHQYHFGGAASGSNRVNFAVTTFDLEDDTPIQALRDAPRRLRKQDRTHFGAFVDAWNTKADGLEIAARLSTYLKGLCEAPLAKLQKVPPPVDTLQSDFFQSIVQLQDSGTCDTVAELAAAMGLKQAVLRDRFRQYSGSGLPEFLRNRRLERAVCMLEVPGLSIGEIAEQLRFSSVQTFSRVFKERYGVSPSQYESLVQRNLRSLSE